MRLWKMRMIKSYFRAKSFETKDDRQKLVMYKNMKNMRVRHIFGSRVKILHKSPSE